MPLFRIGDHRTLSFPRRPIVSLFRTLEALALNVAGRRWRIDRFNRLIDRDVRETSDQLRSAGTTAIVGIPFYKEAPNIEPLVATLLSDLETRGEPSAIVIIGERRTKDLLLETPLPSSTPLVTIARLVKPAGFGQKPGLSRRSWSHWQILQIAARCRADVVFIDADVRNAAGWIHRYLDAIRNRGAQVAVADYVRRFDRDDAMVHIWDSLLFGALFRKWVAFRHGGDYAISRDFVPALAGDHSVMRERTYTMDSAVIARAATRGAKIASVWLGSKQHTPISTENLFQRLPDVVRNVFDDVDAHLPGLLRFPPGQAAFETRDPSLESVPMHDLVGPDFRRDLHADMTNRFQLSAAHLRRTLGPTQFTLIAAGIRSDNPDLATLPPRAWAKATLRFLMRYIRNPEQAKRTTLVTAYVPILELGILDFLNRSYDLTYEEALRIIEREYLVQFQQVWNGLSHRLPVYRLAQVRRLPQSMFSRLRKRTSPDLPFATP